MSIRYRISRTSAGWKLVVARALCRGLAMYSNRLDKDWGMIDCISFVIMQERNLTEALTSDHHFEQAGFKVLL